MSRYDWLPEFGTNGELEAFYWELQEDILDLAYDENNGNAPNSAIWEVVIREGLYQNLVENPSVAIGFLLTTTHGPTSQYKEYLDLANGHEDVIVLVALSALVNVAIHRKREYLSDEIRPELNTYPNMLGDFAEEDYKQKEKRADQLISHINGEVERDNLLGAKATWSTASGLYDNALISYLDIGENLKYLFISDFNGVTLEGKGTKIDPTGKGQALHAITDKRVLSIVGMEDRPDKVLSIPIQAIEEVDTHIGWTKDRIEIKTNTSDEMGPYDIWVLNSDYDYDASDIESHLEG